MAVNSAAATGKRGGEGEGASYVTRAACRCWVGTSGWNYPHWSGAFYPKGMKPAAWFAHYARYFDTVEVNSTFYRLPSPEVFIRWAEEAPPGFTFALKASRFITHIKRLHEPERSAAEFFRRAARLGHRQGPILFQLPPSGGLNLPRLQAFLAYLGRQRILPDLRAVFEFREPSWLAPEVQQLLGKANAALCLADWLKLPVEGPVTASFVYLRRHGTGARYADAYSRAALSRDAERIKGWLAEGKSVFIYFNNDAEAHAVRNALTLKELLA